MDKRRYERLDIDEPVGVHKGENYTVEKARQFSEAGMLFESTREFEQGQVISVTFQLSESILIKVEGEVAYIFKPVPGQKLIGVRFLDVTNDEIKVLLKYFEGKQR